MIQITVTVANGQMQLAGVPQDRRLGAKILADASRLVMQHEPLIVVEGGIASLHTVR